MAAYQIDYPKWEDDGNIQAGEIVYFVRTSAAGNPLLDGQIPALGTAHPWSTSGAAKLDRHSVKPLDTTGTNWAVTCLYSSDNRFSFPDNQPTSDTTKTLADSFAQAPLVLPFLYKRTVVTFVPGSVGGGGTVQPTLRKQEVWDRQEMKIFNYLENVQVKLIRNSYTSAEREAIKRQINKFHYLAPNPPETTWAPVTYAEESLESVTVKEMFQFNGCDVVQLGPQKYQYTYSWTRDVGNHALGEYDVFSKERVPGNRPPWHRYIVVPGQHEYDNSGLLIASDAFIAVARIYSDEDVTGYSGAANMPGSPVV